MKATNKQTNNQTDRETVKETIEQAANKQTNYIDDSGPFYNPKNIIVLLLENQNQRLGRSEVNSKICVSMKIITVLHVALR